MSDLSFPVALGVMGPEAHARLVGLTLRPAILDATVIALAPRRGRLAPPCAADILPFPAPSKRETHAPGQRAIAQR